MLPCSCWLVLMLWYNVEQGMLSLHDCTPCDPGVVCPTAGMLGTFHLDPDYEPWPLPLHHTRPHTSSPCCAAECHGRLCECNSLFLFSVCVHTAPNGSCAVGHYCPPGTVHATDYPCEQGTYTNSTSLSRAVDCSTCPPRVYCPRGTGGVNAPLPCYAGAVCPAGTGRGDEFPCPAGTYSAATNLANTTECTPCPVGSYCIGGMPFISGPCAPGHYCPLQSSAPDTNACPAGTYSSWTNLTAASDCTACPPGSYCPLGSSAPQPCLPGSYSNATNTVSAGPGAAFPSCVSCPGGSACGSGAVTPTPCPTGQYSAANASACAQCPSGYYCDDAAGTSMVAMVANKACSAGLWCPAGMAVLPTVGSNPCPPGYFCVAAAPAPVLCAPGSFNPVAAQASCQVWYCTETHMHTLHTPMHTRTCSRISE